MRYLCPCISWKFSIDSSWYILRVIFSPSRCLSSASKCNLSSTNWSSFNSSDLYFSERCISSSIACIIPPYMQYVQKKYISCQFMSWHVQVSYFFLEQLLLVLKEPHINFLLLFFSSAIVGWSGASLNALFRITHVIFSSYGCGIGITSQGCGSPVENIFKTSSSINLCNLH